jgi:hypothetical protein
MVVILVVIDSGVLMNKKLPINLGEEMFVGMSVDP